MSALFHVSEDGSIGRFHPRPPPEESGLTEHVVWAVDEARLPNYLFPRDCPRVTFSPRADSRPEHVARLIGVSGAARVVAIEAAWFERAIATPLSLYELPADTFRVLDAGAGYYVSSAPVTPKAATRLDNPLLALLQRDVEVRVVPSLWPLRDAVVASTLQFSVIRFRNAAPRR